MPHYPPDDGSDEDSSTQLEIKLKRFHCYLVIAGVVSFLFGVAVGIVVALTQSEKVENSFGDECANHNPADTGCVVPECARMKYEEITAIYPTLPDYDVTRTLSGDDDCPSDQLAATALAMRWTNTNNTGEMEDSDVYFALATLFFSLRGDEWNRALNWLQPLPVCEWHGINCTKDKDGKNDVIVALSLPDNQMVGEVPTQLGLLTSLQSFSLEGINLGGTSMPSEIGRLVDLETLNLRGTKMAGQLPSEIGVCTKLTMLDLLGSELTGTVPTEIGNLNFVESLSVGSVFLAGPLPTEIGHLSRLTSLHMSFFPTTESVAIPSEVALLSNMMHLVFFGIVIPSNTWLTDALVVMTGLTSLVLTNEANINVQHSSTIPTQIGLLTALDDIKLINTGLNGTLPTELARLTKLTFLELWSNDLSGTIPSELGLLTDLAVFNLFYNHMLTGFVPSEVGLLTNLSIVDLRSTGLSIQIPPEVCAHGLEVIMSGFGDAWTFDACK
ncbi:hypothetical protein MHU86_11073 [Fragilaria crotonensis]|nr:hypothetical protein MHU86_11073 [Fragilaria crotonensis]